jgi:hypothetical protein
MRTMTVLISVAVFGAALLGEPHAAEDSDETTLRHLKEIEWPRAYRDQDDALLDRILAPEFRMIGADGRWSDKAGELEHVRTTRPGYDSFRFEITRLDVFENGTAIIAGTGHVAGTNDGGDYAFRYESSNVLIRRDGRWQAVASHVSGIRAVP